MLAAAGDDRSDRDVVVIEAPPGFLQRDPHQPLVLGGRMLRDQSRRLEPFVRDPEVVGDLVDHGLGDHGAELLVVVAGLVLDGAVEA